MTDVLDLSVVDVDGAIRESAEAAGVDRRDFLRKGAVAGGAVIGSSGFMAMLPEVAAARPSKKQDLKILNFALTLELLEAAFYKEAVDSGALTDPQVLNLARLLNADEQTHVTALRQTIRRLGGKPVSGIEFDFMGTNRDQAKFVETSFVLENTGVRAYVGQAPRIKSKALLGAAASIATVEARHASAIAVVLNQSPFAGKKSIAPSGAFDRASSMKTILNEVEKTGFIKS